MQESVGNWFRFQFLSLDVRAEVAMIFAQTLSKRQITVANGRTAGKRPDFKTRTAKRVKRLSRFAAGLTAPAVFGLMLRPLWPWQHSA